jgi:hypothetical protein
MKAKTRDNSPPFYFRSMKLNFACRNKSPRCTTGMLSTPHL